MKDHAQKTYTQDYEQCRFNDVADAIIIGVGGIIALAGVSWLIACAVFNTLIFNF